MSDSEIERTKKLIGALLRMPPKPHSDMKLNKPPKPHKLKRKKRGRPPKKVSSAA
jgi:hypothetical protein